MLNKLWIFHFLIINIVSFQLAFGESIIRMPSSIEHSISINELQDKMVRLSIQVKGKELPALCEKDSQNSKNSKERKITFKNIGTLFVDYNEYRELETEYIYGEKKTTNIETQVNQSYGGSAKDLSLYKDNSLESYDEELRKLSLNACSEYMYIKTKKSSTNEEKCKPRRLKGTIDSISQFAIDLESEDKEIEDFKHFDDLIRKIFQKGLSLKMHVTRFLDDDDLEEGLRSDILIQYIDKVVMPLRDLLIISKSFLKNQQNKYDNSLIRLFPIFSEDLFFESGENKLQKITMGLRPSIEQNHINYVKLDGGMATLEFNANSIIQRDIISIMKAPTKDNYVLASKWLTLHMMASQLFIYKAMTGDESDITIPRSCQNHFNGNLPKKLKYSFTKGTGDQFLNNIVNQYGLVVSEDNPHYLDYYINNVEKNPLEDNYNGLAPFEELKSAEEIFFSKEYPSNNGPLFDDYTHSDQVLSYKSSEIKEVYTEDEYKIKGIDLIEKIISRPAKGKQYELKLGSGQVSPFILIPERQNLSIYIAERMQRVGATHYKDLLSINLRNKLYNKKVKIDFPRLYGANVWRHWALTQLRDVLGRYKGARENTSIYKAVRSACNVNSRNKATHHSQRHNRIINKNICGGEKSENIIGSVHGYLNRLIVDEKFTSIKKLQENKIVGDWKILSKIWSNLRDRTDLFSVAKMNEYSFLQMQMQARNTWAMIRLGYLLALEEFENQKNGFTPKYVKGIFWNSYSKNTTCFHENVKLKIKTLKKVGRILKVDKSINIGHADKLLSNSQKRIVWEQVRARYNDRTSHLITQKFNKKSTYDLLEDISFRKILTKEDARNYSQNNNLSFLSNSDVEDEWDDFFKTGQGRLARKLHHLYTMKGDVESQVDAYERLAHIYGINSEYKSKAVFLAMDSAIKKPMYKEVFKQAAFYRKMKVESELQSFCELNPTNHEKMQAIFHQTTVNHMKLNQLAGLTNKQLDKITDNINSMSPEEWFDMFLGFGAAILAIAAIGIGVMCTGVTGGLCAPLGVAMIGAGTTALGMQLTLFNREFGRKIQADDLEKHVKRMEDLGFAVDGSSENVSRTWVWSIVEAISIIPLIGAVSKSVGVGAKMAIASTHALLKETGKRGLKGFKNSWKIAGKQGRGAMLESDIVFAQFVAGQRSLLGSMKDSTKYVKNVWKDISKIKSLHAQGRISTTKMLSMVAVRLGGIKDLVRYSSESGEYISKALVSKTIKQNDADIAKTFTTYWGKDLHRYYDHVKGFWGKWSMNKKWRGNRFKYAEHVMKRVAKNDFPRGTNWIMKLRFEHLAKIAPKARILRRALKKFTETGKVTVKTEKGLKSINNSNDFALHFMDDMTDIHKSMGIRFKELPYMFALQGGPHTGGLFGKRVPTIFGGAMGDNFMMRKLFTARARLYYESHKSIMKNTLRLPKMAGTDSVLRVYKAFAKSVEEAADKANYAEGTRLLNKLSEFNSEIAKRVSESAKKHVVEEKLADVIISSTREFGSRQKSLEAFPSIFKRVNNRLIKMSKKQLADNIDLDEKNIAKVLFEPQTESERAFGEIIWSTIHTDELFNLKNMEGLAYDVARQLSSYKNADEFDRFTNALKMLVIKRDVSVVEIF